MSRRSRKRYPKWHYRKPNRTAGKRRKYPGRNYHHFLLAKSLGGNRSVNNLLLMHIERHEAWHKVFGLMTAEEAVALLQRAVQMKKNQKPLS